MRKEYLPFGKPNFSEAEVEAVTNVVRSGWIGMGREVEHFENELCEFLKCNYTVTVNSCTSALHLSLIALNIKPGDEVICPSLTWCSSANAALYVGANIVFSDINHNNFCIDIENILNKITPRTKAIIVVHYGGFAIDVKALRKLIPSNIFIVEDAAHAIGAKYPDGSQVGSSGNLTCFSFYANKNLSTGEGGAITLNDEKIAKRLKSLRQHGLSEDAWKRFTDPKASPGSLIYELGYKMNYTDLNACIGRVQLSRFYNLQSIRIRIARFYIEFLEKNFPSIGMQVNLGNESHAHHLFPILLPLENMVITRGDFIKKMRTFNICVSIHYAPLHKMPFYLKEEINLPKTNFISERLVTLPISASMTINDAEDVCYAMLNTLKGDNV